MKTQPKFGAVIILLLGILQNSLAGPQNAQNDQNARNAKIKGQVREQNGKALEGVAVHAINAKNKEEKYETTSDAKGEFTFSGLSPGDYSLSFHKAGFKAFSTRKLEVAPNETVKLSRVVELVREGEAYSVIRGAVLYGAGYSLPNATVEIERIDGGKKFKDETISREGGEFAFRLKALKAIYRLTARARGFLPASTEIEIENDEVRNVALTLQPAR